MDILGVGPLELILILILALVIFGPDKLPQMGSKLGQSLRDMRKATREFSKEIEETRQILEAPGDAIKDIAEPFQAASTAASGARELLSNPSKAIGDYVMGQYAAGEAEVRTAMTDDKSAETALAAAGPAAVVEAATTDTDPAVTEALATLDKIQWGTAEAPTEVTAEAFPTAEMPTDAVAAEPYSDASAAEAVPPAPVVVSEAEIVPSESTFTTEAAAPIILATELPVLIEALAPEVAVTEPLGAVEAVAAVIAATEPPATDETAAPAIVVTEPAVAADSEPSVPPDTISPTLEIKSADRAARGGKRHRTAPRRIAESDLASALSGETETNPVHLATED